MSQLFPSQISLIIVIMSSKVWFKFYHLSETFIFVDILMLTWASNRTHNYRFAAFQTVM